MTETILAPTDSQLAYTGPDPREQDEAARHAAGGTTEASDDGNR